MPKAKDSVQRSAGSRTPAVFDFEAIRGANAGKHEFDEDQAAFVGRSEASARPAMPLAELIAEEKQAWDAETSVRGKADLLYFSWREQHPKLDIKIEDEEDLPEPMGGLYRQAEALVEAANALTDRLCAWVPASVDEAAILLEWSETQGLEPTLIASVRAGLHALAARETRRSDPEILRMFRDWRRVWRAGNAEEPETDEFERLCEERTALERRIFDAPAGDARGLAVKAFMVAHLKQGGGAYGDDGEPRLDAFSPKYHYTPDGTLCLDEHALRGLVESLIAFLPEVEPLCRAAVAVPTRLPSTEGAPVREEAV